MLQLRVTAIYSVKLVDMIRLTELQPKEINSQQTALLIGQLRMIFFGLEHECLLITLNPD